MNETLLYIILGVLYLVFTLLGKAAKKKQQEQKKQEPWSLEDVLGDFQGSPRRQPQSSAPPPTPQPEPLPVPFNWSDEFRPFGSTESENSPSTTFQPTELPPIRQTKPAQTEPKYPSTIERRRSATPAARAIRRQLKDSSSARTAIVLSEILGRPKGIRRPYTKRLP
jgi:hypothetical protein